MSANQEKLRKIFNAIDIDGDQKLSAAEILKAFEKEGGKKPTLSEVHAMINEVDEDKDGALNFHEFCVMVERVHRGELPRTTGIPSLIKGAWEDYIEQINKPVEKNKPVAKLGGKGGGVVNPQAEQGQIYKIEKKGPKRIVYNNLPEKKNLSDLK